MARSETILDAVVADLSHECNNYLAFVLSNLQNLAEYADDLQRLVTTYRQEVKPSPALAELEAQIDVDFILPDAGRAAREALVGGRRLRDVLRVLGQVHDKSSAAGVYPVINRAIGLCGSLARRAEIAVITTDLQDANPTLPAGALAQAITAILYRALLAFGDRAREQNHIRVVVESHDGRLDIFVETDAADPTGGSASRRTDDLTRAARAAVAGEPEGGETEADEMVRRAVAQAGANVTLEARGRAVLSVPASVPSDLHPEL